MAVETIYERWEALPEKMLNKIDYGSGIAHLQGGEIAILGSDANPDSSQKEIVIERILKLPDALKKGDISDLRNFLSLVLQLPVNTFELACCGQRLPLYGDLDYYTVDCQPIVLARNMKEVEIINNGGLRITIRDEIGKAISLKFEGKTPKEVKVKDVKDMICEKEGVPMYKIFLSHDNFDMEDEDLLSSFDVWNNTTLLWSSSAKPKEVVLFIKTLSGKTINLYVRRSMLLEELKEEITKKEGIPPNQQRLIFADELLIDGRRIGEYGIENESTLDLVLMLRGGGGPPPRFVDLSSNKTQTLQWSDSAPMWRTAKAGLCLEGICKNRGCEAFKRMVIVPLGMGAFDFILDQKKLCQCPVCGACVKPITAAFSNCKYRWAGIKVDNDGSPKTCKEEDFKDVGDEYLRFDESEKETGGSGMVGWVRLVIYTKAGEDPVSKVRIIDEKYYEGMEDFVCPITLNLMRDPVVASDGHSYEAFAIEAWYQVQKTSPITRESLSPTFIKNRTLKRALESLIASKHDDDGTKRHYDGYVKMLTGNFLEEIVAEKQSKLATLPAGGVGGVGVAPGSSGSAAPAANDGGAKKEEKKEEPCTCPACDDDMEFMENLFD